MIKNLARQSRETSHALRDYSAEDRRRVLLALARRLETR